MTRCPLTWLDWAVYAAGNAICWSMGAWVENRKALRAVNRIRDGHLELLKMLREQRNNSWASEVILWRQVNSLYDVIAHGDEEHRKWLKDKLDEHFSMDNVYGEKAQTKDEAEDDQGTEEGREADDAEAQGKGST